MEVHQAHAPVKKEKHFKHYLFEFLMLFIAVTLGFFVENRREHYIEHKRAKELAKYLYEEMKSDSANLVKITNNRKDKEIHLQYLIRYFKDSSLSNLSPEFYPHFTWGLFQNSFIVFEPKDGMLQQLKNSGSLRYFQNIDIQKSVGDFSVALNNLRSRLEREIYLFSTVNRDFLLKHYDFSWLSKITNNEEITSAEALKKHVTDRQTVPAVIRSLDKLDRVETISQLEYYITVLRSTRLGQMIEYQKTANHLIQILRKEYHLE